MLLRDLGPALAGPAHCFEQLVILVPVSADLPVCLQLEFGEETRKEHGGAMVTQEEQGPRGLYGSDEEDDDNSEGGWKLSDEDEEGRQREQQLHKPTLSKSTARGPSKVGDCKRRGCCPPADL